MAFFQQQGKWKKIIAFTTTKKELPIHLQRAFNENENPDIKKQLWENIYQIIGSELDIHPNNLVFAKQTHSNHVAIIDGAVKRNPVPDTDGLITQHPGICLCIQTADCVPVFLFDKVNEVVSILHSGWKGTALNISGHAVSLMKKHYLTQPQNLQVIIGPCISQQVYEVGSDVFEAFKTINLATNELFIPGKTNDKFYLNLPKAIYQQLIIEGVAGANIKSTGWCTFQDEKQFYSARRDGGKTGRIISGILLHKTSENS